MNLDPELMKQLVATFQTELSEQSQVITDGLLQLEKNNLAEGEREKIIEVIFRAGHNIKGAARGLGINDIGEIAHRIESLFSRIQKKSLSATPDVIDICLEAVDKMKSAMSSFVNKAPLNFDLTTLLKQLEEGESTRPNKTLENKPVEIKKQEPENSESIRVNLGKIDKISALMEEIQINKISIDDQYNQLAHLDLKTKQFSKLWKQLLYSIKTQGIKELVSAGNDCFTEMNNLTNRLNKNMRVQINEFSILSNSFQEEVRMLRLIPASTLLCTFPRYVRDLSKDLNKKIELEVSGNDVHIDKLILEGLKDPINHLIRNAIDHGIEADEARQKNGKSTTGLIRIDIKDEGGQIVIGISDDGAGMDADKIAEIAKNKNFINQAELDSLTQNEKLQLIFKPGFSTKDTVSDISGRGVGLDVVKENLSALKGNVSVSTELGKGTTFYLKVPLTLSSERGLLIESDKQLFVIPIHVIERVLSIHKNDIIEIEGSQAIILDEHPVPMRSLAEILGFDEADKISQEYLSVVIVKSDNKMVAFLVDEVIGEREIVIKPLQEPLSKMQYIAGGTLLERNQVVVVLNPNDLMNKMLHERSTHRVNLQDDSIKTVEKPHILVVDDSITTRTLEKSILEAKNYQVTIAVNGKEAWDILQRQKFSLLITDVSMPIMDGFMLTEQVKKSEKLRDLPVIIVTSLGSDAEKARGIEVGANAYVVKNEFESGMLLEIVKQLV